MSCDPVRRRALDILLAVAGGERLDPLLERALNDTPDRRAAGFLAGGWFGAKLAVSGGERVVRIFMVGAALFLAGRLIGIW